MRPYSRYLQKIKSEGPEFLLNLGGTTPPLYHAEKILKPKHLPLDLTESRRARSYAASKKKLAHRSGFNEENIEFFPGTSQALFQIFAGLTQPGDCIAVEVPCYSPVLDIARFLGLKVLRFQRSSHFRTDLEGLKNVIRKSKLAFLTNPHCPSGVFLEADQISQLNPFQKPVIVDEIYLPHFCADRITLVESSSENLISISGFSKTVGLSSLRLSWALGQRKWLEKAALMGLNLTVDLPTPSFIVADQVLAQWDPIISSIRSVVEQNRRVVFKQGAPLLPFLSHDLQRGHFVMLKKPKHVRSEAAFMELLRKESLFLRPGSDFEMRNHFRLHLMAPPQEFRKALRKLVSLYRREPSGGG